MRSASNFIQTGIDKSSLLIAAIAPLLWIVDAFRSAIFLNDSFLKQLFFPESSALFLRLWLVFFILIQAWFFNSYSRTHNRALEVEKKLRSLFDLASDALVVTDIEGKVVEASGKAVELWGYSLQELSALDLTRLCAANESERLINFIREIIKNKTSGLDNVMLAVKDSLTIPADIKGRLIDNLDVQDSKVSASSQAAEEKLKQERGRIEEAIKQEETKKFQEQTDALEHKYGEILKARVAEARQQAEELIRQEEKKKSEETLRQAEAKFASESGSKISEGRKLIEDSVRQEEQRKAEESAAALKQKYEELLRKGIEDERRRNEESAKAARSQLEESIRQKEKKKREDEIRAFEVKYAEAAGIKMSEERSRIEATVRNQEQEKALEAINELKLKHEELLRKAIEDERRREEESIKKAEAAVKALELKFQAKEAKVPEIGKLVSGVGQQMLNPLSAVLNYLKVIKIKLTQGSEFKPLEFKDTINLIEENALLCKNILSSLSDPSRVTKTAFQPVSLNDVIAKIDTLLGQELRLQNITVSKALQANLANISGDPLLLTQVVFNLISNAKMAIKNNPYAGGGTLVIKTQSGAKDSVELLITDNGAGIPVNNLPRIFEPFFTTKPDGLGLGLTIAKSIVKEHKGEIEVESKEGIGSTFKVIIPALKEKED
ncbi:MAG: ATP-binding protein [Candidatus Omnitrophica bacterium]|nr:ATP-binding protein [Candidatus Omnitrophota bacterium]